MELSKEHLDKVLEMFKPEFRWLKEIDVTSKQAEARFEVGETFFAHPPLKHYSHVEMDLCLAQFSYAAFSYWATNLGPKPMTMEEYLRSQREGVVIADQYQKNRDMIPKSDDLTAKLELKRFLSVRGLLFAKVEYEMNNCFSSGYLKLAKTQTI